MGWERTVSSSSAHISASPPCFIKIGCQSLVIPAVWLEKVITSWANCKKPPWPHYNNKTYVTSVISRFSHVCRCPLVISAPDSLIWISFHWLTSSPLSASVPLPPRSQTQCSLFWRLCGAVTCLCHLMPMIYVLTAHPPTITPRLIHRLSGNKLGPKVRCPGDGEAQTPGTQHSYQFTQSKLGQYGKKQKQNMINLQPSCQNLHLTCCPESVLFPFWMWATVQNPR